MGAEASTCAFTGLSFLGPSHPVSLPGLNLSNLLSRFLDASLIALQGCKALQDPAFKTRVSTVVSTRGFMPEPVLCESPYCSH